MSYIWRPANSCIAIWCPGSDIRIMSWRVRLRMSEPKGHWQILDSSVVLDLTFASRARSDTEANIHHTRQKSNNVNRRRRRHDKAKRRPRAISGGDLRGQSQPAVEDPC